MKNIQLSLLITVIALFNFSGTLKNNSNNEQNVSKIISSEDNKFEALGSAFCTVYNQSNNTITSIEVQTTLGNTTYNNPSFPLHFAANGNVTIIIHFSNSGSEGGIRTYELGSSWNLISCEDYDPQYLSPISYSTIASDQFEVIVSNTGC
jgi:hypothetical protein